MLDLVSSGIFYNFSVILTSLSPKSVNLIWPKLYYSINTNIFFEKFNKKQKKTFLVHKNVGRFEVPMYDSNAVQVLYGQNTLGYIMSGKTLVNGPVNSQKLIEIPPIHVIQDKTQIFVVSKRIYGLYYIIAQNYLENVTLGLQSFHFVFVHVLFN